VTSLINETKQLLVIDSQIENWQSFIVNIAPDTSVLVLNSGHDGLVQLANAIAAYTNLDAIQIISHGSAGSLQLGSVTLSSENINLYTQQLTAIGNALSANGDLLLYGCDVAQGDAGQQFIEQLSVLTGADVAASTNLTGDSKQGGDWVLESQTGTIESSTIALQTYTDTLIANIAPTLTTFISPVQTAVVNSPVTITFADLLAKGNATDSDGIVNAFVIKAVNSGTLQFYDYIIPAVGTPYWSATPRAWGDPTSNPNLNNTLNAYNKAVWTPSASDTGIVNAFTVAAVDNSFTESVTPIQATIQITSNMPAATLGVFFATDATHGNELWVTDGTTVGTHLLKDIYAGIASSPLYPLFSQSFTVLGNGKAVFSANDGINGTELWITDGTAAGTNMVKDIDAGLGSSIPTGLTSLGNGKAVFTAFDAIYGGELWITDGTAAGTNLVKDIATGIADSIPVAYIALGNGKAIFSASVAGTMEQWITDGTSAGTVAFKDVFAGTTIIPNSSNYNIFTSLGNGKAVFSTDDGVNGIELWITDGTTAGTSLVKDIYTGTSSSGAGINSSYPNYITSLGNGKAVFSASDANYGNELWITDGTAAGTNLVKDIATGGFTLPNFFLPNYSYPNSFTSLGNGKILFTADDSINGRELWVTDGTTVGTYLVKDIVAGATSSNPTIFTSLGYGKATFSATNALGVVEQWITDGTSTGTLLSSAANASSGYSNPTSYTSMGSGKLLFSATDATNGTELWITNGTAAGTTLLKDINLATASSNPSPVTMLSIGTVSSNAAPTGLAISTSNVNENVTASTVIGTLTSTDPDAGNTFTYSLVAGGVDNAAFSIVGDKLQINNSPNFEAKSNYNVLVRTTDQGGLFFDKALTIGINNVNEAPTLTTPATVSYTDTTFVDNFVNQIGTHQTGVLLGSDVDAGTTLTYGITGGVDNLDGTVSKGNAYGTLTVTKIGGAYTFAPLASAIEPLGANVTDNQLTVTVSDGALTTSKVFTVAITQNGSTETIGNDVLIGGVGINSWAGLAGNDTYYVDVAGDSITEAANGGTDMVYSTAASYTLSDNIENLVVWGGGVNGTGNALSNYVFGSNGNNTLDGGAGTDILYGGLGNDIYTVDNAGDVVTESLDSGFDTINTSVSYTIAANVEVMNLTGVLGTEALNGTGNDAVNYLFGNAGNNIIDGKAGADAMVGKAGDDTYYVDNIGDVILENTNEGIDTVISSVSYSLLASDSGNATLVAGANADNLIITGAAINAFGNGLNNNLTGNSNNNVISGGAGIDTMTGGAGNDVYYVDVAGDTVIEQAGEGADIVYSMATDYTLSDNIETIVVWGSGLNGTGNAQDNYVFGNTYGGSPVNNILSGGAGNDILMGFDGADTYIGGTGQDTYNLTEQIAATDTIQIAAGDSVVTVGLMDKATGFTLGANTLNSSGVDKLDLVSSTIAANAASQNGTDSGAIQTNSITNGIINFQGVGGATIAANALNLNDALTYLQTNINDGSSVAFVAGNDTYVFQDGGVTDTVVDLIGVHATSMNNTGLAAGAVWLV
jgi:ELWxxDGT repeat protein